MGKLSAFYRTRRWQKSRLACMERDMYLCQMCRRKGKIKAGNIAHHKVPLTESNIDTYDIAYNIKNLECVCQECHNSLNERSNGLENFMGEFTGDYRGEILNIPPGCKK